MADIQEEYREMYKQQGKILDMMYRDFSGSMEAYKAGKAAGESDDNLNIFRLKYCAEYCLLELSVEIREHLRATSEAERFYSVKRMLVTMQEITKHVFGVIAKSEKKSLWYAVKPILNNFDQTKYAAIDSKVQAYKAGFVSRENKKSRDIFEHYAFKPEDYEDELKKLKAEVGDVHMKAIISVMSDIVLLCTLYIWKGSSLCQYVPANISPKNEPEIETLKSLSNLYKFFFDKTNDQANSFLFFNLFYEFTSKLIDGKNSKYEKLVRIDNDFNQFRIACIQIQRDLSYAQISLSSSEYLVEQYLNVRYIFRRIHDGIKLLYGYDSQSKKRSLFSCYIAPYISAVTDEYLINEINTIENEIKEYASSNISDEGKRAIYAHVGVSQKSLDDYLLKLFEGLKSNIIFSELTLITDFYLLMNKLSYLTSLIEREAKKSIGFNAYK